MLSWDELENECSNCTKCELAKTRGNIVIGRGNENAPVMLVGEGPGKQEDEQGKPFVGPAGQLLDLLISALMFKETDLYICNIVKCRPPENRIPSDVEVEACLPYLRSQLALIKPKIIVCLGATAMKHIIDKTAKISQARGQWVERKGYLFIPTFHPAALLRDESKKVQMFDDFKKVKQKLDEIRGQ